MENRSVRSFQSKPKSWLWGTLTSIRLTVFLLLILAAVAVIGTVVPQNQSPAQYFSRFGEVWGALLWRGGFTWVYFSPWFLGPIALLAVNILACVVHGLPQAVKTRLAAPHRRDRPHPAGTGPESPGRRKSIPTP